MKKALAVLLTIILTGTAHAGSVTVTDSSDDLAGVSQTMAGLMIDAGLPLRKTGDESYAIEATNLHCDYISRMAFDATNPLAGVPAGRCRIGAKNERNTKTGKPFPEAHSVTDLMQAVQAAPSTQGKVNLVDCAMGYCGIFARTVRCSVNTAVKTFDSDGRWICLFDDGNK